MTLDGPLGAGPGFDWADPYAAGLLVVGLAVFAAIGALSHEDDRAFSASLIYLALGLAAAVVIGLSGIDWLVPREDAELIERLSELAVVIALFSTGLKLDRPLQLRAWGSVTRLLAVTMPLTIAAVAAYGVWVMGLPVAAAILLASALAPTDPVLAGDIGVGPPGEADETEPKFAVTAEAGLNDGLAFPFVVLALFISGRPGAGWLPEWVLADVVYAVLAGVGIGAVGGYGIAAVLLPLRDRRLVREEFDGWIPIASVLVVYAVAELASSYGFLAAFAAGIAFRRYEHDHEAHQAVHRGSEVAEKFGELAVILLLGSMVTLSGLGQPGWRGWLLCALLLLVIRPLAVAVAFVRSGLGPRERLFLGWFGVRGIGSLYYVAAALSYGVLRTDEENVVFWTVAVAILISVTAHGITGTPLTRRLLRRTSFRTQHG
ncbi:MAG TPA: cation:proton antiporter [Gaiella sp.]|uniref:cation:proton antiporter n=1 Tax=Gaiella sp. TaxID=2663207 RepID=UPI002D801836|nr:cation:proton antiporter [Gaiella sp.]HET9286836.1 cation:proton antiporter [Gaiella sp.]